MSDVPDDGYKTFVCVETAAVTTPQRVTSNTPGRLACTLRVVKK